MPPPFAPICAGGVGSFRLGLGRVGLTLMLVWSALICCVSVMGSACCTGFFPFSGVFGRESASGVRVAAARAAAVATFAACGGSDARCGCGGAGGSAFCAALEAAGLVHHISLFSRGATAAAIGMQAR